MARTASWLGRRVAVRCLRARRLDQRPARLEAMACGGRSVAVGLTKRGAMRRIALVVALVAAAVAISAGTASSATSKSSFQVFVEPTISAASNGLTLQTELEGSFNVANKTASGNGSYAVMAGSTVLE